MGLEPLRSSRQKRLAAGENRPGVFLNRRMALFANEPAGRAFQAVDQRRNGYFGRMRDRRMEMLVFPVKFDRVTLKIPAIPGKYFSSRQE